MTMTIETEIPVHIEDGELVVSADHAGLKLTKLRLVETGAGAFGRGTATLRWKAEIMFRDGTEDIRTFEEIKELHNIVERGPDWNEIDKIVFTLNRRSDGLDAA
jgi:hypothetical protein